VPLLPGVTVMVLRPVATVVPLKVWLLVVEAEPVSTRVAPRSVRALPLLMIFAPFAPRLVKSSTSVPLTVSPPVKVFAPLRVSVPAPALVREYPPPKSVMVPLTVSAAPLFTVHVWLEARPTLAEIVCVGCPNWGY